MARIKRKGIGLPGEVTKWLGTVSQEVARQAAFEIVTDLKFYGPYWTGAFESAWVVKPGLAPIPATKDRTQQQKTLAEILATESRVDDYIPNKAAPNNRRLSEIKIPRLSGTGKATYSIGNEMVYRDVALDLKPGRTPKRNNTAPEDWFATYIQGGKLRAALKRATIKVSNDPKIKNYKGKPAAGELSNLAGDVRL